LAGRSNRLGQANLKEAQGRKTNILPIMRLFLRAFFMELQA